MTTTMNINQVKSLLLSVWQKCPGKESGEKHCTTHVTHQIVFIRTQTKRLQTDSILGLNLTYEENNNITEGKYCFGCGKNRFDFVKLIHSEEQVEMQEIPGIERAVEIIRDNQTTK